MCNRYRKFIMAEGGVFAWKRQKIIEHGPAGDYSMLKYGLPEPPEGLVWRKDEKTKEWKLIKEPSIFPNNELNINIKRTPRNIKEYNYKIEERVSKLKEKDDHGSFDYVEHVVMPSDTFQGLCITYKISAVRLRQVNMFSGTNLKLAPKKLIIPVKKKLIQAGKIRLQDKNSIEYKAHSFQAIFPDMIMSEVR